MSSPFDNGSLGLAKSNLDHSTKFAQQQFSCGITGTTTLDYAVTGVGTTPAKANDFVGNVRLSGTVAFAAGVTSKALSIRVRGDVAVEANEGFRVTLLNVSLGASISTALASGVIRNDDL